MGRTTAIFSISLPSEMAKELTRIQKSEHRTRSELVSEALRVYIKQANSRSLSERIAALPEEDAAPDEREALKEGRAEFRKGQHVTLESLRHGL
ncbi:MAG: ribbon-helix-helix protein, CopG family [Rhodospirillales bacterium]|nr:MAG: ribbon-helix-helix protein, CopG family [Rhodospirillales bacterium]